MVTADVAPEPDAAALSEEDGPSRGGGIATTALLLLPGALVVYLGFNAGGFFPGTPALAALILSQLLLLRVTQAENPFEGLSTSALLVIGGLGAYAVLAIVSSGWSHATGRTLLVFNLALVYLLLVLLLGSVRGDPARLRVLLYGLVAGLAIVCFAGLISRVLPRVLPTSATLSSERLSYPVTYWNVLGMLSASGLALSLHLTSSLRERTLVRVVGAALVPLFATTLYFTFSRGSIAAGAAGILVYMLLARPHGLASGLLAVAPPTAVVLYVAYRADLLASPSPTTPAAVVQGHHVALALVLGALAAAGLRFALTLRADPALARSRVTASINPTARRVALAAIVVVALIVAFAAHLPHTLSNDWHRFFSGAAPTGNTSDFRRRLTDPANNGRTDLWRVALHGFSTQPLRGRGAGTYEALWNVRRRTASNVANAHSLYLETMSDLGILGVAALLVAIVAAFAGLVRRARGGSRSLYGAVIALGTIWALHNAADWDWQMPVSGVAFLTLAAVALSPRPPRPGWRPGNEARLVLATLCLACAVVPVLVLGSQARLNSAERSLQAASCNRAGDQALSSINWLSYRSEPYEIVGFCDIERGFPRLGVAAMREAVRRDPNSWETHYALALALAAAGQDPRAEARTALAMNPRDPLAVRAAATFAHDRSQWAANAAQLRTAALATGELSISPA